MQVDLRMHALAICCLLLAAVCVAPTAASIVNFSDINEIDPPTHRKSGKTDKIFKELLKELGEYLLDRAKEFGIGKYKRLADAIIVLTSEREIESFVLEFFDGWARKLLYEFIRIFSPMEGSENHDLGKFFKYRWTAVVSQFLNVLGGEGDDLLSTSTSLMEAITTRLLQLVEELPEHEAAALARFSSSIVKNIVEMATNEPKDLDEPIRWDEAKLLCGPIPCVKKIVKRATINQRLLYASIHIIIDGAIPLATSFLPRLLKMRDTLIDYERQPYDSYKA